MTDTTELDTLAVALISLARSNIPPDVQELLLHGNPDRGIPPGALKRLIEQVTGDLRSTAFHVISDIRQASGLGARPMLSELAGEIGEIRKERDGLIERERQLEARAEAAEADRDHWQQTAAAFAGKAISVLGVTDEMVDRVFVLACCARHAGAGDGCGTVEIRMPTRSSLRAALEAVLATTTANSWEAWWTTPHDRLDGKRPCDDPGGAALLLAAIAHGLPA